MIKKIMLALTLCWCLIGINSSYASEYYTVQLPTDQTFHYEKDYQRYGCELVQGEIEHVLPDRSRVDCLTNQSAIEYDFVKKHYECYTQALYYAVMTGRNPVCMIIVKEEDSSESVDKVVRKFEAINNYFGLEVELQFIRE